ncbi:hypothetical protein NDU88_003362 [Pleurodeles waltl]|uniref:Uncharacterized protein n=1 Tax=Pleurodeles waltl TaxID=8319 RepID=A0AAV7Q9J9_PLEWA|nr:hypothetical protein NDU88_003362 [Pleurodeles waltl]
MGERRLLWEQAAAELFDETREDHAPHGTHIRTTSNSSHFGIKKWWEMTSLTKYIENGRVPRGLHILILPTLDDMDSDLLEQWRIHTADCSLKLMGTLIIHTKRRMKEQIKIIEQLTEELERVANQQEVQHLLTKMEEQIKKTEDEIKTRKAHKFNRDKMNYEHGRIYTFARKYDTLRLKEKMNNGVDVIIQQNHTDESSDLGSLADEAPLNKLDFRGEM